MINWEDIRKQFPACNTYTYLNAAGASPISIQTAEAVKQFYDDLLLHGDIRWEHWLKQKEQARLQVAQLIHADTDEIGFVTNASQGMNYVADIFKDEGTVLSMDHEFPSTTIPWLHRGIQIDFVPALNNTYPIEHIEQYITSETRVLVSSFVQYKTGFRQDLQALNRLCKKHQLIHVVNATQGIGVFPIDVKSMGIDLLVFTGLKWAMAGYGASVLYMSKQIQQQYGYPAAGWLSVSDPGKMNNSAYTLQYAASVVESGCTAFQNIIALGKSLELFNAIGSDVIAERILFLTEILRSKTKQLPVTIAPPHELKMRSGITIFDTDHAATITEELKKQNIIVAARGTGIRVALHIYNNEDDIVRFSEALKTLL